MEDVNKQKQIPFFRFKYYWLTLLLIIYKFELCFIYTNIIKQKFKFDQDE